MPLGTLKVAAGQFRDHLCGRTAFEHLLAKQAIPAFDLSVDGLEAAYEILHLLAFRSMVGEGGAGAPQALAGHADAGPLTSVMPYLADPKSDVQGNGQCDGAVRGGRGKLRDGLCRKP